MIDSFSDIFDRIGSMTEKVQLIAILGPEGSGKSILGKSVASELNYPCVSTGDMIREAAKKNTSDLEVACKRILDEHIYLSPQMLLDLLKERFSREDVKEGVVLDGGFRTLFETENFLQMLDETNKEYSIETYFLKVPKWMCVNRLLSPDNKRRRVDDTPEAILKRMNEFNTDFFPRMSYIRKNFSLEVINGTDDIETVASNTMCRIRNKTS